MTLPDAAVAGLLRDPGLPAEFEALCDTGGRLTGTPSEAAALVLLRRLGRNATGRDGEVLAATYDGWRATRAELHLVSGAQRVLLPGVPLLRSTPTVPGGFEADVVSAGRGTPEEFEALGDRLRGRIALVRHEYMFASGHIHRRRKYAAALAAEAAGFLISGPLPASAVAGSSGRGTEAGIPAFGISPEAAARLSAQGAAARLHMTLDTEEAPAATETLLFDIPASRGGTREGWVVLSAHLDGHDPAESAMDNASGVAVALAVARALAPHAQHFRRGLRLALFSAEEWALTGSRTYLHALPPAARDCIALNVNLDSVGGAAALTALCSGFPALASFVARVTAANGVPVPTYLPLMENSDHANFAQHGIPALRLVAGFDDPQSNLRHVLTAADTRDKVAVGELRVAALASAALVWAALTASDAEVLTLRRAS